MQCVYREQGCSRQQRWAVKHAKDQHAKNWNKFYLAILTRLKRPSNTTSEAAPSKLKHGAGGQRHTDADGRVFLRKAQAVQRLGRTAAANQINRRENHDEIGERKSSVAGQERTWESSKKLK